MIVDSFKYYLDTDINSKYTNELWKPVVGFEGLYEVSNLGRVKTLAKKHNNYTDKLLKPIKNPFGYVYVMLSGRKHIFVHRLVAQAFILNKLNKPFVNHKNGDKEDNRHCNLEWCTRSENQLHGYRTGLLKVNKTMLGKRGVLCCHSKPIEQYTIDGVFIKKWSSQKEAARELKLSQGNINSTITGRYKHTGGFVFKFPST